MSGVVLGVDSGSTKTHMALADRSGRLLAFVEGEGTGHEGKGFPACARILKEMVDKACAAARVGRRSIRASCFGICGADIPEDIGQIRRHMVGPMRIGGDVWIFNDAFLPIHNDRYRERGIGVTCGGWHKWVGMNRGRVFMHEGSVFVGIRQLVEEELIRVGEGFREPSAFTRALLKFLGFSGHLDFFRRRRYGDTRRYLKPISRRQRGRFLHMPKFLGRQAARGSREAARIIQRYAAQVAEGVEVVSRKLGLSSRAHDVVLSGSILVGIPELSRAVARLLKRSLSRAKPMPARFRPVRGALVFAAQRAWGGAPAGSLAGERLLYG